MNHTSRILRPILEFLFPSASPETITYYHGIVRKIAHFTEYAVLGLLACRSFIRSRARLTETYPFFSAFGLVALVAILDEANQSFNPARTGSPVDVLIDLSGGVVAIVAVYLLAGRKVRPS